MKSQENSNNENLKEIPEEIVQKNIEVIKKALKAGVMRGKTVEIGGKSEPISDSTVWISPITGEFLGSGNEKIKDSQSALLLFSGHGLIVRSDLKSHSPDFTPFVESVIKASIDRWNDFQN